ncbi:MAG: adenylate/guanylate cyclase domain-containing protein [Gammaproteobacteria bacterium]|nr:adenylate/guanylate cyclase domain-containing protein [Gammaproteobacteria bacterium]
MTARAPKRRLAAILSADVAGYTRMMRADEAATLAALKRCRELMRSLIEQHSGWVVDTAGDGLLAEFGSAVNAVECAVAAQQRLAERNADLPKDRKMQFRIGVNLGDVLAEDGRIYGDGVNVAARVQSLAEPGGICISGMVYSQIQHVLDLGYDFLGKQKVKSVVQPIPVYRIAVGPKLTRHRRWWLRFRDKRLALAGSLAALLLIVAVAWVVGARTGVDSPPGPGQLSIAVLPFTNLNNDPGQEYFADGITDDLITELTKIADLTVIARDSSFTYKGQSPDVRQVAHKLNVRYVLEGSVRREARQVRINAQLIDAATGKHLWADRYDGGMDNVFALQDKITQKIVSALALRLTPGDRESVARQDTGSAEAYEDFLRGREHFYKYAKDGNQLAKGFYEKAIERDPKFAKAYAMLGWAHAFDFMNGWTDAPERSLKHALKLAQQGTALDPSLPVAYFVKGLVYRARNEYAQALVEAEKAIALDRNYANAHVLAATLLYYAGRPQEGLERMKQAIRLNPHYPSNYSFHLGQTYFILKRYDEAIEALKQGLEMNPTSERLHVWLAAAYAQSGNQKEAEWEVDQVLALNPEFSLKRIAWATPFQDSKDMDHFLKGLRKAGFK